MKLYRVQQTGKIDRYIYAADQDTAAAIFIVSAFESRGESAADFSISSIPWPSVSPTQANLNAGLAKNLAAAACNIDTLKADDRWISTIPGARLGETELER